MIAVVAGLIVFVIAHELFPYHSSNHDEGVYLQQAAMLLEGQLWLTPGSEALREAFHPWFFVESDQGLYPKYAPVPAAVFALGAIASSPRVALAVVAVCNVALVAGIVTDAFDRRTGILAAVFMAAAPLFLLPSAVFLPYAPTTALNLLFTFAYTRTVRRPDPRYAVIAGLAIGFAFFARPYTAVIFAAPFIAHALWRTTPNNRTPQSLLNTGIIASLGLAVVGVTLGYNHVLTGSAFRFPYEAFAPLDGIGFGQRRILGHEIEYTPELALRSNAIVLWTLATRWFTAGPIGTMLAGIGITAFIARLWRTSGDDSQGFGGQTLQLLLLGLVGSIIAGNLYFWGNFNIIGNPANPNDGIITVFGPFYHYDLLLPLSAFAAHGTLLIARHIRALARRLTPSRVSYVVVLLLLATVVPLTGVVEAWALSQPIQANAAYTEKYDRAYAPFEETDLENALVFIPPTYGEFQNHPFQWLRNDPGFDGPTVYALARNPPDDFAVIDAYPDRDYYRYRYHGTWTPDPNRHVHPILEPIDVIESNAVTARTEVTVPDRIARVSVALSAGNSIHRYNYGGTPSGAITVSWTITKDEVTIDESTLQPRSPDANGPLRFDGTTKIGLAITLTEPGGGTLTYREELVVRPRGGTIQGLWPPSSSVCLGVTKCGLEGTYLPNRPDTRPDGVEMNTTRVSRHSP